jgi:hypothetical protein
MDSQQLEDVARRHGIQLLLQFGPRSPVARAPTSDLDLAVLRQRASRITLRSSATCRRCRPAATSTSRG